MATDARVPATTYLIGGLLVAAMVLPVVLFAEHPDADRDADIWIARPRNFSNFESTNIREGLRLLPSEHLYRPDTLRRFEKLLDGPDWTLADPARNPQGMVEAVHGRTGLTFVLIPAGSFQMGSPEDEEGREPDEGPVHTVTVTSFLMCSTECTQAAWDRIGGKDYRVAEGPELPIEYVSWTSVRDWSVEADLRLPSEAEWERACRAGTRSEWWFGSRGSALVSHAWCRENRMSGARTHPVGTRRPNPWGLFDITGNVNEWCEDKWHDSYIGAPTDGSAWNGGDSSDRLHRGGSFISSPHTCRSADRKRQATYGSNGMLGFRPARSLPGAD